ncbi:ubiquitin-conjugating enzyme/RWD-like protein [Limtongia smithiae]|uniref:ubiquitin-conjugating enzyme/RWD-like protein n=1 Tax=Limtongia smithiae TaxID=1125753 RepID=UPI0034CD63B8
MSRARRIGRELQDVTADSQAGVKLELVNDSDLSHLKGYFTGPPGTPYAGGQYKVDIQIPDDYPFKPPVMKFDTKVYHPNISSQTGAICLDILKDKWSPVFTLRSSLLSLQSLLSTPEPNDPQDAEVAKHYLTDRKGFDNTARYWAKVYANAESADGSFAAPKKIDVFEQYGIDRDSVKSFENMGFTQDKIIEAMRQLGIKKIGAGGPDGAEDQLLERLLR